MDCVVHLDPTLLQEGGEFPDRVLGLGHRKSVSGNHYNPPGIGKRHRHVIGVGSPGDLVARICFPSACLAAERHEEHSVERAVHGLDHDVREDQTRGAHESTGDDQGVGLDDESGRRRG